MASWMARHGPSLRRASPIVQHELISISDVYIESMSEWVQMSGRGIGFMCQWCQLFVSPSACVPMGREVRWEVGGEIRHVSGAGWSAEYRACGGT